MIFSNYVARKLILNGGAVRPTGLLFDTSCPFIQNLFSNFFSNLA